MVKWFKLELTITIISKKLLRLRLLSDNLPVSMSKQIRAVKKSTLTMKHLSKCILFLFLSGCYSLSNTSIDYTAIRTYYISNFRNNALNAFPDIEREFTEALKEKIRTQSRLVYDDANPNIEFNGTLVSYRITSEAPQPGENVSLNRLTIVLAIEYIDNTNEENNWKSNFSHFVNFDATEDVNSIQEDLVEEIRDQLMEDIFNKAFTNW